MSVLAAAEYVLVLLLRRIKVSVDSSKTLYVCVCTIKQYYAVVNRSNKIFLLGEVIIFLIM